MIKKFFKKWIRTPNENHQEEEWSEADLFWLRVMTKENEMETTIAKRLGRSIEEIQTKLRNAL